MSARSFTPRETVSELDRYIIGQDKAKRAVAVALRNRWRRQQVSDDLREEISPKNIIMIGATGVGKTEIARRLAKLARAPFVKVEASKFTEVGYVGRDVESMIRDLVEVGIKLVQKEAFELVRVRAEEAADDVLIDKLALQIFPETASSGDDAPPPPPPGGFAPFGFQPKSSPSASVLALTEEQETELRRGLSKGEYDTYEISLDVEDTGSPFMTVFGSQGTEEMNLKDMMSSIPGFKGKRKRRTLPVPQARELLIEQEAAKLVDSDRVQRDAIERTEQAGIVFLDEIDKVVSGHSAKSGPDVSREGVQRDLLPIVEGSTVSTKYGPVKTDHILFVAAGAFHVSDIGDMIPELQGRFPIRVELDSLHKADFVRILTEPKNSLTKQYTALMKTEGVALRFSEDGIEAIADYAAQANERSENIGARRLHTILEALLEELSFSAPEREGESVVIDRPVVEKTLEPIVSDARLAKYIL